MPTPVSESVRETLGEQVTDDLSRWVGELVHERAVVRDKYREVLSYLDLLEAEVEGINDRLDRMEERFDQRLDKQSTQFNQRIDRLHEQMRVQDRRTVGTVALFGTIVTVLLAIAEFGG